MFTVNGIQLTAVVLRNRLHQQYNHNSPDICKECDGCGTTFTHAYPLDSIKRGLIIMRHDEIKDELSKLLTLALIPHDV